MTYLKMLSVRKKVEQGMGELALWEGEQDTPLVCLVEEEPYEQRQKRDRRN